MDIKWQKEHKLNYVNEKKNKTKSIINLKLLLIKGEFFFSTLNDVVRANRSSQFLRVW